MATLESLSNKISTLQSQMKGLGQKLERLESEVTGKASTADLNRYTTELRGLITDNATLITELEKKLATVILPDQTQYYLSEGEVQEFQSNFNKLKAMMVSFEKLYKNLVSYSTNLQSN